MTIDAAEREQRIETLLPVAAVAAQVIRDRYGLYSIPYDDLRQYAAIGAIQAADRFNGVGQIQGYAWARITGAVLDGVRRELGDRRSIRMPNAILVDDFEAAGLDEGVVDLGYSQVEADALRARVIEMVREDNPSNTDRAADIYARHLDGEPMSSIGESYDITESRVCQIVHLLRERVIERLEMVA